MIRVNELKLPAVYTDRDLRDAVCRALRVPAERLQAVSVLRRALDCRKKPQISYVLNVAATLVDEALFLRKNTAFSAYFPAENRLDELVKRLPRPQIAGRCVVVGSGPAGLFAALTLAKAGLKPIVLERGSSVERRKAAVERFFADGQLDTECNVQFGEGGAGTFSDGKLNTGIGGEWTPYVLGELAAHGAPQRILTDAKPHVGSDLLGSVCRALREEIVGLGGEVRFDSLAADFRGAGGVLTGIAVHERGGTRYELNCAICVLAIGHSARDTFRVLSEKVAMQPKAFSVGVRIEHLQETIDTAQYGRPRDTLPPADYKLACKTDFGNCYTFCMCPGGYVVPAASEVGGVVTNGMSNSTRDGVNADSALLVGVSPAQFGENILDGVAFQRRLERLAYDFSGSYRAPCQRAGDFMRGVPSTGCGAVRPTYAVGVAYGDLRACLPDFVVGALRQGIGIFGRKLRGFDGADALLTGVETRSSSPVRILRGEDGVSSLEGLYPCGEGAGYAGGIVSAAADGIRTAVKILSRAAI